MASVQTQNRKGRITYTVRHRDESISRTFDKPKDGDKWARAVQVAMDAGTFRKEDHSPLFKKKMEAVQADQEQQRKSEAARTTPTLAEGLDFYLSKIESKGSYDTERKRAAKWKSRPLGNKLITEITPDDIIAVRDEMAKPLPRRDGTVRSLSVSTIHNEFTCVSNVYRWASGRFSEMRRKWPGIPENIENPVSVVRKSGGRIDSFGGIPKPSPNHFRRKRIASDMEDAIYAEFLARDVELAAAWRIAVNTGMRINEILNVHRAWIDLKTGSIEIPAGVTKNGEPRTVALNRKALEAFGSVIERDDRPTFRGRRKTRYIDDKLVFSITYQIMYDNFTRIRKKLAETDHRYVDLRIHDTKHEAASRMISAGMTVPEVMSQTGNTRLESMRRYINPTLEEIQQKINRM